MKRTPISGSSTIAEAGYNSETEVLEVMFSNGTVYQFHRVPEEVAAGLLSPWVGSAGQYFERNIRHAFPYKKL